MTTGSAIATELRAGGYAGTIVIRSANHSRTAVREYKAAGADAVMSKDEKRGALLHVLASQVQICPMLASPPGRLFPPSPSTQHCASYRHARRRARRAAAERTMVTEWTTSRFST